MKIGDEITIKGICKGGRVDLNAPEEDLQLWRVDGFSDGQPSLTPMESPGVVDQFNAMAGVFRLVTK